MLKAIKYLISHFIESHKEITQITLIILLKLALINFINYCYQISAIEILN